MRWSVPGVQATSSETVQESLTNVLKHAGAAHARVVIDRRPDAVTVEVVDDGPGAPPGRRSAHGDPGNGLRGMEERVSALGGTFSAGCLERGFAVRAVLSLEEPS